ncbi:MAG: penicillin acylase family protein [Candidatus Eremiobacteraeota bacterium]|nr:penicillin acylase family protein [Candidatus Eremiobacteraeota bacterium]
MASTAEDPHRLDRRREEQALELFRYVGTFDAVSGRLLRHALVLGALALLVVIAFAGYVAEGFFARDVDSGVLADNGVSAPVTIRRDDRDVPHVSAATESDLMYGQGFAEATDRLFQMELTRRYALGTLAEVLGPRALSIDEEQRAYGVRDLTQLQWHRLDARSRADLQAFARGVNAAMRVQPLPVEFRLLLYRPRPWTPQDSLAVSLAVSIALGDSWRDVLARDEVWRRDGPRGYDARYPLSDPAYDVTIGGAASRESDALRAVVARSADWDARDDERRPRPGSNAWATGAARGIDDRALLANDPHLELTIPGLWYVVDLRAPGFHVAGAAIPGAPGVALGHNERIAWGATNADAAATSVFDAGRTSDAGWMTERFRVRFSHPVARRYYRVAGAFGTSDPYDRYRMVVVRRADLTGTNPIATFLALDRATTLPQALAVLSKYDGPAENFVLANARGEVAYHMAGAVIADAAWGRYVQPAGDVRRGIVRVPFDRLPAVPPRLDGVIVSANNKMYGSGYPYRLAPYFDPPYRAYRIAELLHARVFYDAAYFERMQLDEVSTVDREFARRVAALDAARPDPEYVRAIAALKAWDGRFSPDSRAATFEHALRSGIEANVPSLYVAMQQLRRGSLSSTLDADLAGTLSYGTVGREPWGRAGAVTVEHPLAPLHFGFLNGTTMPGAGDEYTIRLQEPGFSQSFRAVWVAGDWDRGGIVIPSGESGRPGSHHYLDLAQSWITGTMEPLPFSERAVVSSTRARLTLRP